MTTHIIRCFFQRLIRRTTLAKCINDSICRLLKEKWILAIAISHFLGMKLIITTYTVNSMYGKTTLDGKGFMGHSCHNGQRGRHFSVSDCGSQKVKAMTSQLLWSSPVFSRVLMSDFRRAYRSYILIMHDLFELQRIPSSHDSAVLLGCA